MKNIFSTIIISILLLNLITNAQNITNTLPANGIFKIKSNQNDFLSIDETSGDLRLFQNIVLPLNPALGIIFKGDKRFIHTYKGSNAGGSNLFIGENAGNFTNGGSGAVQGTFNTGVGTQSLSSLTIGAENSAFGELTLMNNTSGDGNSAFGNSALTLNTSGFFNSGFGLAALQSNSTGWENSAFGIFSLRSNTTGSENTAVGSNSLQMNTTGFQNTAVGHHSLQNNTGNYNTAIGYNAGSTVTTGSNLTLVGIDANPSSPTAIDQITLGNQYVNSLRCNVQTITSLSDARDKKNIQDLSLGLDFITKLKPRQFNWDRRDWYEGGVSDGSKMQETPTAGFIAQEFDEIQKSENAEWLNLVLKDNPEKWEATYGNLLPVMVKAIQELKFENEQLKSDKNKEIAQLKSENIAIRLELESLKELQVRLTKLEQEMKHSDLKFSNNIIK